MPQMYFPYEGRRAEDFPPVKNPTASAGFEPANLGTKGQHATTEAASIMSQEQLVNTIYLTEFQ